MDEGNIETTNIVTKEISRETELKNQLENIRNLPVKGVERISATRQILELMGDHYALKNGLDSRPVEVLTDDLLLLIDKYSSILNLNVVILEEEFGWVNELIDTYGGTGNYAVVRTTEQLYFLVEKLISKNQIIQAEQILKLARLSREQQKALLLIDNVDYIEKRLSDHSKDRNPEYVFYREAYHELAAWISSGADIQFTGRDWRQNIPGNISFLTPKLNKYE